MKFNTLFICVLLVCGVSACDRKMLGASDAEDHKLIPETVIEDPNPVKPTSGLAVIQAKEAQLWLDGQSLDFQGVNLDYAQDPVAMMPGLLAIKKVGANVIRVTINSQTSPSALEAVLANSVAQNISIILTYHDESIQCKDDEVVFSSIIKELWLKKFLSVIAQDRFQKNLMISLANGWGPKDIFVPSSTGYKVYIDSYKTAIRAFRKAGFEIPLVIEAACGNDFYAFAADRGRELLAADSRKNLILGVRAEGPYWDSQAELDLAVGVLRSQKMPFLISEFGGSGVGDKPIKHQPLIEFGAGNYSAQMMVPWKSSDDKVAVNIPLSKPINLTNTDISFDVWLAKAYVADEKLGFQMYLRDINQNYANITWNESKNQTPDAWNTLKATINNAASFGWKSDAFDITQVAKIGIEWVANGKAPNITGAIKFDNFKIAENGAAKSLYAASFTQTMAGWESGWKVTELSLDNGKGVALTRAQNTDEIVAIYRGITGVDFSKPVQIKANIYVPAEYQDSWMYGKFFNNEGEWVESGLLPTLTPGQWNEVILPVNFGPAASGYTSIGLLMGGLGKGGPNANPNFYGPVLIQNIEILGQVANNSFEPGIIYSGQFENDSENWIAYSWGDSASVEAKNGALSILPTVANADRVDVQHKDLSKIDGFNLKDPFSISVRIYLPDYYKNIASFTLQFYMQDSAWANHFDAIKMDASQLKFGAWNDIEVAVAFPAGFERSGYPKHLGWSFSTSLDPNNPGPVMSTSEPILIDNLIFKGLVPVEKKQVVLDLIDFLNPAELNQLKVDFTAGSLVVDDFISAITRDQRSKPFSWVASSWYKSKGGLLDLVTRIDDPEALTERGIDIVKGKGGFEFYRVKPPLINP